MHEDNNCLTKTELTTLVEQNIKQANQNNRSPIILDGKKVKAEDLREVILQFNTPNNRRGIYLRNGTIIGDLDLYNTQLHSPLRFRKINFENNIIITHAKLRTFELRECEQVQYLIGRSCIIKGNFKLTDSVCEGSVLLEGARITGWADFSGSTLRNKPQDKLPIYQDSTDPEDRRVAANIKDSFHGLTLSVAQIDNDLRLNGLTSKAPILLENTEVGKQFSAHGAEIGVIADSDEQNSPTNQDPLEDLSKKYAMKCSGIEVKGNADLGSSILHGALKMDGCKINGKLSLYGSTITGHQNTAIDLDHARIEADLLLGVRKLNDEEDIDSEAPSTESKDDDQKTTSQKKLKVTTIKGCIKLLYAKIGGDINLSDTNLYHKGYYKSYAMRATGLDVEGQITAINMISNGVLELSHAKIHTAIHLILCRLYIKDDTENGKTDNGTTLPATAAFNAPHIKIEGNLEFRQVNCTGQLNISDSTIDGSIFTRNCALIIRDNSTAFAFLAERTHIGASLIFEKYEEGDEEFVIDGDGLEAPDQGDYVVKKIKGLTLFGGLSLQDSKIDGSLEFNGGSYKKPLPEGIKPTPLNATIVANELVVGGKIQTSKDFQVYGHLNFSEVEVSGDVLFKEAYLIGNDNGISLQLTGAEIRGDLRLGSTRENPADQTSPKSSDSQPSTDELPPSYLNIRRKVNTELKNTIPEANKLTDFPTFISKGRVAFNRATVKGFLQIINAHIETRQNIYGTPDFVDYSIYAAFLDVRRDFYIELPHPLAKYAKTTRPKDDIEDRTQSFKVSLFGPMSLQQASIRGSLTLDQINLDKGSNLELNRKDPEQDSNAIKDSAPATDNQQKPENQKQPIPQIHKSNPMLALRASGISVYRDLYFGRDFRTDGETDLTRANVGQDFILDGIHDIKKVEEEVDKEKKQTKKKKKEKEKKKASTYFSLKCPNITVGNIISFNNQFYSNELVDLTMAQVGNTVYFKGAKFKGSITKVISMPAAIIMRNLVIEPITKIYGYADFTGAQIKNDFQFYPHSFKPDTNRDGIGLFAPRIRVEGTLYWGQPIPEVIEFREVSERRRFWHTASESSGRVTPEKEFRDYGEADKKTYIDLTDAYANILSDSENAWPERKKLRMNGFKYDRIAEGSNTSISSWSRLDWLKRQQVDPEEDRFQPQPYENLVSTYRRMGKFKDAEIIDVRKVRKQIWASLPPPIAILYILFISLPTRFGYSPVRAIVVLLFFWILGASVFSTAFDPTNFKVKSCMIPAQEEFYVRFNVLDKEEKSQYDIVSDTTAAIRNYPSFNPWRYSLDTVLPIIDLSQSRFWIPKSDSRVLNINNIKDTSQITDGKKKEKELNKCAAKIDLSLFGYKEPVKIFDYETPERLKMIPLFDQDRITLTYSLYLTLHIIIGWMFATIFALAVSGVIRSKISQKE